jgi:uncharacterized protein (DUF433 family)
MSTTSTEARPRVSVEHIEITPGTCGGKPRIAGHRIRVQDIYVWHELQGQTPEEIVANFPQLTLGDVHGALAYYWDHKDEMHRRMAEDEAFVEEMRRNSPPSRLKEKLAARGKKDGYIDADDAIYLSP